jgi:hypothetical protein
MPRNTTETDHHGIPDGRSVTGRAEGNDDGVLEYLQSDVCVNDLLDVIPHLDPDLDDIAPIEKMIEEAEPTPAAEDAAAEQPAYSPVAEQHTLIESTRIHDAPTPIPSRFTPKPGDKVSSPSPHPARLTPPVIKGQTPPCSLAQAGESLEFSDADLEAFKAWAREPLSPIPSKNTTPIPGRSGHTPNPFERRHSVILPDGTCGNLTLEDVFKGYDELHLRNGDEHGIEVINDGMTFRTIDRPLQIATSLSEIALASIKKYQFSFRVTMSYRGVKDDPIEFDHVKNAMRKKYGNWPPDCDIDLLFEDEALVSCELKLGRRFKNDKHIPGDFISDSGKLIAAALGYAANLEEMHINQKSLTADIQTLGQYYMAKVRRTPTPHGNKSFVVSMGLPPFDSNPLVRIIMGCEELTGVPSFMPYAEFPSTTIVEHSVSSGFVKGFLVFANQHLTDRGGFVTLGWIDYSLETPGLKKYMERQDEGF